MRIVLALSWTILYLGCFALSVAARDVTLSEAKGIAKQIANEYPEAVKLAYNSYPRKEDRDLKNHSRTEFWDRVIQKLHSIDPGYCYIRSRDGLHRTDLLGYCPHQYRSSDCNTAAGGSLAEFTILDFISSSSSGGIRKAHFWWGKPSIFEKRKERVAEIRKKDPNHLPHPIGRGHCVFPRPGAPNYGYVPNHPGPVVSSSGGTGGSSSGNTDPNAIKGECGRWQGPSDESCNQGRYHRHPGHTNSEYRWTCRDIPHTGEIGCSESKTGGGGGTGSGNGSGPTAHIPGLTLPPGAACPNDAHWKEVGGECLPSCGHAKNIYCAKNDCSGLVIANGGSCTNAASKKASDLKSYQSPCCLLKLTKP